MSKNPEWILLLRLILFCIVISVLFNIPIKDILDIIYLLLKIIELIKK